MKTQILIGFLLVWTGVSSQKMITKTGSITFEASVPSFEEVKATNSAATAVLNINTAEFASLALIKGFRFKVALMEEHFNENYIESDKFPKATFKGVIENFDPSALTATAKDFIVKGQLEIRGRTRAITAPVTIRKTDAGIEIVSYFSVNANDFGIAIPSVVKSKVSSKVNIKSEFTLK